MFPIPFNFPFIKRDGSRTTIGAAIDASSSDPYVLPTASTSVKGGIKVGDGLTMDGEVLKLDEDSGGSTITILWENNLDYQPDGTLIDLSSSDYDFLIVNAVYNRYSGDMNLQTNQVILKGYSTTLIMGYQVWEDNQTKIKLATRTMAYVNDTRYRLSNGYAGGDNSSSAFVRVVYGVKL